MNINTVISKIKDLVPGQMNKSEQALLLSTVELLLQILSTHQQEIQLLKDEVNRLKGEQGKPNIPGNTEKQKETKDKETKEQTDLKIEEEGTKNHSSEEERKEEKPRKKKQIKFDSSRKIDKEDIVAIENKEELPTDIVFKGYATSHYQSLEIVSKLIAVKREIYYSAKENKTYTAALPQDYEQGCDYTRTLMGHLVMLRTCFGMSIEKTGDFLRMHGVDICNGTVSNIVLGKGKELEPEYKEIHRMGVEIGLFNQTDTTGARVNGVNYNSHVFGNEYYTAYFTRRHKDRQTVLDLLRSEQPRAYLLNKETLEIYHYLKIPKKVTQLLGGLLSQNSLSQSSFINNLQHILPEADYLRQKDKLLEGAYLAHYQSGDWLTVLVCDDAPQYKLLAVLIALCWIHIGRHFKKINPKIKHHQELLADFLKDFWHFYHKLKAYKKTPSYEEARKLDKDFDYLFSRKTGFDLLDQRIAKTKAKKQELLVVLKHPYVPLHNNDAELAARKEVQYRDISFQTRNQRGSLAKDVFFTIIQTCKKLGVNPYAYILDKITKKQQMTPLPLLMQKRAFA